MLEDYRIGELVDSTVYTSDFCFLLRPRRFKSVANTSCSDYRNFTDEKKIHCKLIKKDSLSHDVRLFQFALPCEDQVLGLRVGQHMFLCATIDDKLCMRAYTPTSEIDRVGYFHLVIKVYFKGVHPKFPNDGLMSQHLDSFQLRSFIEIKGPSSHIEYASRGTFIVDGKAKSAKNLTMLSGDTGIMPIYQVMQAILKYPEDETEMFVTVFLNKYV